MFWKRHINAKLNNFSKYHIDMEITEVDGFRWHFTGIYGEPSTDKRENTWKVLRTLNDKIKLPWLCAGDFNEIMYSKEKKGGPPRNRRQMENFRSALADCGLRDLGFRGDKFTWRNNSFDARHYVKERLDRAVATREWCEHFPAYKVINGDPRHSDHRPVTINVEAHPRNNRSGNERNTFRFEARWLEEEDCGEILNNAWKVAQIQDGGNVREGLRRVAMDLKDWDANVLGDLQKRINSLKQDLEDTRREEISQEKINKEHFLREKLDRLEHQLDIKWKQRAHVKWLQSGDRNTAFFHAYASERKRKNTIKRLKRDDGAWIEDSNQLKRYITNYFFSIFSASARDNNEDILQTVQPKVSAWMNDVLCSEYTEEEAINALKSIGDLKAPGPDGMSAVFFKRFWKTVGVRSQKKF